MSDITGSVEGDYQKYMEMVNQEIAKTTVVKRLINTIKLEASVAVLYGGLISLAKFVDPQYANVNFVQYLKSASIQVAPYLAATLPIGYFFPEISKVITWAANQPMRWGSRGIDYISRLRR